MSLQGRNDHCLLRVYVQTPLSMSRLCATRPIPLSPPSAMPGRSLSVPIARLFVFVPVAIAVPPAAESVTRSSKLEVFTKPIFFNCRVISSAVEFACRLDRQVAITKKSAMDVLFFKSTTLIFSDLVSSRMALTFSTRFITILIGASKEFSLFTNFCGGNFDFSVINPSPRRKLLKI